MPCAPGILTARAKSGQHIMEVDVRNSLIGGAALIGVLALGLNMAGTGSGVPTVWANDGESVNCPVKPQALRSGLINADADDSSGLNNHYWAVVVNRAGVVCAVAFSGSSRDSQWLLSRQIAAVKAFTANGLSLDAAPISTAQLYPWVQPGAPGNPLFGLAAGNPVSPEDAYRGPYAQFGSKDDPMTEGAWEARSPLGVGSGCIPARPPSAGWACPATPRARTTPRHGASEKTSVWRRHPATTRSRSAPLSTRIA
jgi:hypothetical protein